MGGNAIRCVAKYLYDNGIVPRDDLTIEAGGTVHRLHLYTRFGTVGLVTVDMGKPAFEPANVPVTLEGERVIDRPVTIAGGEYRITCLSMGNPHCVVFADRVDEVNISQVAKLKKLAGDDLDIYSGNASSSVSTMAISSLPVKLMPFSSSTSSRI